MIMKHKIVIFVGQSACGKTAIYKQLINRGYKGLVTNTTRPMRARVRPTPSVSPFRVAAVKAVRIGKHAMQKSRSEQRYLSFPLAH